MANDFEVSASLDADGVATLSIGKFSAVVGDDPEALPLAVLQLIEMVTGNAKHRLLMAYYEALLQAGR